MGTPLAIAVLKEESSRTWPSPRASDGDRGGPNMRGRKGDLALPSAVLREPTWPTPAARDWKETAGARHRHSVKHGQETLPAWVMEVERWRTPTAYDGFQRHNKVGTEHRLESAKTISLGMQMSLTEPSGRLNPAWVGCLQGMPPGWLDALPAGPPSIRGRLDRERRQSRGSPPAPAPPAPTE